METDNLSTSSQDVMKDARAKLFRQRRRSKELATRIDEIFSIVNSHVAANGGSQILNDGLADYIFWPISRIFAQRDKFSLPVVEAALRGISVLIAKGWSAKNLAELFPQLLLLFSTILGSRPDSGKEKSPTAEHPEMAEETIHEALAAIRVAFSTSRDSPGAGAIYKSENSLTQIGNTLASILDQAHSPLSPEIQTDALTTLDNAVMSIRDAHTLAGFYPGIASSLAKLLAHSSQRPRVLVQAIAAFRLILTRVLSNFEVELRVKRFERSGQEDVPTEPYSPEWLKLTQEQTRVALGTVLKLQLSDSEVVRGELEDFCIKVLDECHQSLQNCADILVEAAIMVMSKDRLDSLMETSLKELCMVHEKTILENVRKAAFDRARNFGSVMQMGDETKQRRYLQFLVNATTVLGQMQKSTAKAAIIHGQILKGFREAFDSQSQWVKTAERVVLDDEDLDTVESTTRSLISRGASSQQVFRPIALAHESQRTARDLVGQLIAKLGAPEDKSRYANTLTGYARDATDRHSFSSFWLAFKLVQSALESTGDEFDMFTVFPDDDENSSLGPAGNPQEVLQDIDWRSRAQALEVIEYTARRLKRDFRPELMDVLFPISTLLGDEHPEVRRHALVTLNALAAHCDYADVSELIVKNADYMVDAVALQINSLNLTPAMVNVLVMMTRVTGPKIIPYLEDVIESIFAALDNFHGYPVLVEALFTVLKEVVDQGAKSQTLLIEAGEASRVDHRKKQPPKLTFEQALEDIEATKRKWAERDERDREIDEKIKTGHPTVPWGDLHKQGSRVEELLDEREREMDEARSTTSSHDGDDVENMDKPKKGKDKANDNGNEEEDDDDDDAPSQAGDEDEEKKAKKSTTYTLLNRIANLTQHYLTFPSPHLRKQLLGLLATASPALSSDPNTFLPLINDVWPVTMARLYDSEGFVTIAACETISALCVNAGDFMSSRFKTEWGNGLHKWCLAAKKNAERATMGNRQRQQQHQQRGIGGLISAIDSSDVGTLRMPLGGGKILESSAKARSAADDGGAALAAAAATQLEISGGLGNYALAVKVWEAAVSLLATVVSHVSVPPLVFDEMLDLVADLLLGRPEVKEAFELVNKDAVWLAMYERRGAVACAAQD
ncbi:unnamed protein product [Parascedosporium putredinis]|uniref:ARM repeat-containing protein n=1 Tax=Parascedosporium putredinis TaxID=1442378 RepID=A0A9P1HB69_9PEZI|nr:unnamed protein product [Parascedosporium putredinis]CAI8002434.1 unnamed protein product [Parascedosporium putredinis]